MKYKPLLLLSVILIAGSLLLGVIQWGLYAQTTHKSGNLSVVADVTVTNHLPYLVVSAAIGLFSIGAIRKPVTLIHQAAPVPSAILAAGLLFSASILFWSITALKSGYKSIETLGIIAEFGSLFGLLVWMWTLRSKKLAGLIGSISLAGFILTMGLFGVLVYRYVSGDDALNRQDIMFYSSSVLLCAGTVCMLFTYLKVKDSAAAQSC